MRNSKRGAVAASLTVRLFDRASMRMLVVLASILVHCVGSRVHAQIPPGPPIAMPPTQVAAIPADLARDIYRAQQRSSTCWAACNSMLLAANGIESSEEDQIERMKAIMPDGGVNGAGPHFQYASKALRGVYGDRVVKVWYLDRRTPPVDPAMNKKFVKMIQRGTPVMVATPQHGMVAIAVRYSELSNGHYVISGMQVNDPNPMVNGSRWLPPDELAALFGFMAIETPANRGAGTSPDPDPADEVEDIKLAGRWEGTLTQLGLKVVFKIQKDGDDYSVTTDSPNQQVYGIASTITVSDKDVEIDIETPAPSSFSGTLKRNVISGTFSQGGQTWPLTLKRKRP